MRKSTLLLSVLLAVAVSNTADAAKRVRHHHVRTVAVAAPNPNAPLSTMDQQMKFLHDAMFPFDTKW